MRSADMVKKVYMNNNLKLKAKKLESSRIVKNLDIATPKERQVAALIRAG
jgi:hypothetical protein